MLGVIILALATGAIMIAFFPQCLADPRGVLDPTISRLWAEHIAEAQPIASVARRMPQEIPPVYGFVAIALLLSMLAARNHAGNRWPWILTISVVAVLFALCLWLVRVAAGAVLVAVPLLCASLVLLVNGGRWRFLGIPAGALALGLVLGQTSLAAISETGLRGLKWVGYSPPAAGFGNRPCTKAAYFAPLSILPKGLILGSVDTGPFILLATPHSVVGASYLRNGEARGIQAILDIFLSKPDVAGRHIMERSVDYVVFCPDDGEYKGYATEAPEGLAAALVNGEVPPYLKLLPLKDTALVYRFDRTSL